MRQTLVWIPLDGPWSLGPLGEAPGFGFGIVLLCWVIVGLVWLYRRRRMLPSASLFVSLATWLAVAALIVMLPRLVQRQADAAIAEADQALSRDPRAVDAMLRRAQARVSKREYGRAVTDLRAAVSIAPDYAAAYDRLAWIEATCPDRSVRDGAAAVRNAMRSCELTGSDDPAFLATLAAARAENGDLAAAVATQRQALRLAVKSDYAGAMSLLPRMRAQLQQYERGQPFRDDSVGKTLPHSIPIFGFGAMLFTGFIAAAWTAARRGLRVGYPPEMVWDIGIWLFIAGVVGCRIFYCIQYAGGLFYTYEHGRYVLKSLPGLLFAAVNLPDGGLVYYGGLPTGILAMAWICRQRKLNFLELGDVIVPSLFLGMAFGRIGCFLNGCCYGDRCDLPWGVLFPMGSVPDAALVQRGFIGADQDLAIRLHPTQLYSSIDGLLLALLTHAYFPYRPRNGAVVALAALTYPLTRFAVECLRGDELGQFSTSLTISQWFSMLLFGIGLVFAAWLTYRPKLRALREVSTTRA